MAPRAATKKAAETDAAPPKATRAAKAGALEKTAKAAGAATKRGKAKKEGPKRALSAYMFFSKANRQKVKDENPDVTFGQIGKILGKQWQEMSEKDKAPYAKEAEADKLRYAKEKEAAAAA